MKKTVKGLLAVILIVVLTTSIFLAAKQNRFASKDFSEPVRRDLIIESVYGIGTVKANKSFQLRPGVISTVTQIWVKEGDAVEKGQMLVELEGHTVFSAPFSGTVTSLPVKVGENVFVQTVVLELVDLQDRYVTVSLEQRAAVRVRRGQNARLSFENLREASYAGVVESVYSSKTEFLVRIEAKSLPREILPGMTADVAIGVNERADALLVPVSAIEEGQILVKREGGKTFSASIQTGIIDGAFAEVVSGNLKAGDRVAVPREAKS